MLTRIKLAVTAAVLLQAIPSFAVNDGWNYDMRSVPVANDETAPYVEITNHTLMVYTVATDILHGNAARLAGVSRHGASLYLLSEFNRGEDHGFRIPFASRENAERARQRILQGESIDVSGCTVRGSVVSRESDGFGSYTDSVIRNVSFSCSLLDSVGFLELSEASYNLVDVEANPLTVRFTESKAIRSDLR